MVSRYCLPDPGADGTFSTCSAIMGMKERGFVQQWQDLEAAFRDGLIADHGTHCTVDYLQKASPEKSQLCYCHQQADSGS